MDKIRYRELIISCEACGTVKRYKITSLQDCQRIFKDYKCKNNCGRNLYSFITIGELRRD